jgi:hypothetical protein
MNTLFRFVFLRALPLVQQPELRSASATELADIAKQITSTAQDRYTHHLERLERSRLAPSAGTPSASVPETTTLDERSQTHVRLASWALGAYRTLYPLLSNDEERTLRVVRQGFGVQGDSTPQSVSLLQRLMVRFRLFLARDPRRARLMLAERFVADLGPLFEARWAPTRHPEAHDVLLIHRCLYEEIFRLEGVPKLLSLFCAMDRANFVDLSQFTLEPGLANATKRQACRFDFGPAKLS